MTPAPTLSASTRRKRTTPPRALVVSLLALVVPVVATRISPAWAEGDGALLVWLPPLLPGFLLAYYRGWQGASLALAGGMAALALTQVEILILDLSPPPAPYLLGIVVLLVAVSMGAGWIADLLHREREAAEREALTDALTGLPNRRHATVFLEAAWEAAMRGRPLTVALFDIDRFKVVNDLHGHAEGDRVLQALAGVLRRRSRRMDLSARFGGEEFMSVLSDCSLADGVSFAEGVRASIAEVDFGWGRVTVSAGVSSAERRMGSPDVLVATADRALYEAKERGRNQVVCADTTRLAAALEAPAAPSDLLPPRNLSGFHVLLVDDDNLTLRSTARVLELFGCTVRATTSAREALSVIAGADALDVLVTDIVMPEMSGFTLVDQAFRARSGLPVLYISGYPKGEVYWGGPPGSRSAFLGKPFEAAELRDALLSVLPPRAADVPLGSVGVRSAEPGVAPQASEDAQPTGREKSTLAAAGGRILIVDDEESVVRSLERLFTRAGYAPPLGLTDPRRVADSLRSGEVDLMILDLSMPEMDGFEVLEQIPGLLGAEEYFPVLVLTGSDDVNLRRRALKAGAMDFLSKPFDPAEAEARVRNLLTTRSLYRRVARQRDALEEEVSARTAEIADTRAEILYRLARAAEYRDDVTGRHTDRVGLLASALALELGLPPAEADLIRRTAPLHDLGKIGVPDAILLKPGPLTPEETAIMRSHTTIGAEILGGSRHRILEVARTIALSHHERWGGGGYPERRAGTDIPLEARIVAVVDSFDTITHARPYKQPSTPADAFDEIVQCRVSHFDPEVVEALRSLKERVGLDRLQDLASPLDPGRDTAG